MAGLKLPKLRWLLAGGLAAGIWVVTNDANMPRPPERVGATKTAIQTKVAIQLPKAVRPPASRPARMTTSSIARPDKPIPGALETISRVRMRARADLSAAIVTTLEAGQAVRALGRSGEWRKVSASGQTGWVHGDYLTSRAGATQRPAAPPKPAPRPKAALVKAPRSSVPIPAGLTPVRGPQGGDCQCPYDLMLDGSACGEHSAYVMRGASAARCYR